MNIYRINKNSIILIVVILLFLFSTVVEDYIHIFSYYDEAIAIVGLVALFFSRRYDKDEQKILLAGMMLVVFSLLSNLIFKYQKIGVAILDAFLNVKFWLALFFGMRSSKYFRIERHRKLVSTLVKKIVILFVILFALDNLFGIFTPIMREGLRSTHLFYWQPTYLVAYCVWMIMILISLDNRKSTLKYLFPLLLLMCTTYRSKAIAAVALFVAIYYLAFIRKKRVTTKTFLIFLPAVILIGWEQIYWYFFSPIRLDSARNVLTIVAFKIAREKFPFGSGFGTFASRLSGIYYSPLYDLYGISSVNGLNRADYGYISDSFWPMIIGQCGFIGLTLFIIMLSILYKKICSLRSYNKDYYIASLTGFSYLLIASMAESSFVHPIMMPIAWWFGLLIGEMNYKKRMVGIK